MSLLSNITLYLLVAVVALTISGDLCIQSVLSLHSMI